MNGVRLSDKLYKKGQRVSLPMPTELNNDCILSLDKGWISVDGGQGDFYFSVDNGKTWQKASGTRAVGESAVTSVAQSHGVGTCDLKDVRYTDVKIDLSAYREQTVDVLIAVAPTSDEDARVAFMTVTGVEVPALASAPELPDEDGENTPTNPDEGGENTPTNPDEGGENTPTNPDEGGENTPTNPDEGGENAGTDITPESPEAPDEEDAGCVASAPYGVIGGIALLGVGFALRKKKENA